MRRGGGIGLAKPLEGVLTHVGVGDVKLLGELPADLFRGEQQVLEMAVAARRHHALGGQQEDKLAEQGVIVVEGAEPELTEDGVTSADGYYLPTAVFDEGLAAKLGIPVSYVRTMRTSRPDLYDANVNGWLHGQVRVTTQTTTDPVQVCRTKALQTAPVDPRKFLVRAFRSEGGTGIARAPG